MFEVGQVALVLARIFGETSAIRPSLSERELLFGDREQAHVDACDRFARRIVAREIDHDERRPATRENLCDRAPDLFLWRDLRHQSVDSSTGAHIKVKLSDAALSAP